MAHLCWNHLQRDMGVRVKKSSVPDAGRGLFAAWAGGLPAGHKIPYTGDDIALDAGGRTGGPYVLEATRTKGIDAARRNSGLGRWVNDPRGARDDLGRARQPNCEFVLCTPRGERQRVGAVRTLRPLRSGEELLVRYGQNYWRFQAQQAKRKEQGQPRRRPRAAARERKRAATAEERASAQQRIQALAPELERGARDRRFEAILVVTLNQMGAGEERRKLRPTAARRSAQALHDMGLARAGSGAAAAPATEAAQPATAPIGSESIMNAMRRAATTDEQYQSWLQSPPTGTQANRGLLFDNRGRMRVPNNATVRTRILAELHDAATGAHAGRDRMLAEAQRRFDWQGMAGDVERYVLTCDACQRNKHSKQLKPGLLMPLPLPEEPCMHWTTDAVTGLPKTRRGHDAIQVYVDRLTKLKKFAPAHTSDGSVQLAHTTLRAIIGPHGMPKSFVSDRDPRITARLWKELACVLGSDVNLSTAHHAQTDGQSEREIQTLITALRSYANAMGNDWDEYLPALELAFNSKPQASTGASPFSLVYGTEARLPIDCVLDEVRPATMPAVEERAARMRKAMDQARSSAEAAQSRQKRLADQHRRLLQLKAGDQVLLATDGLQLRSGTHKLTARYVGPFRVSGCVNDNAVTLELPPLLGALHPTFNITRLKPYRDGSSFPGRPQRLPHPPAVDADTNGVASYEVEAVVAQRGVGIRRELLVRWKGYGAEHDEWQRRGELVRTAPIAVAEFDALQQGGSQRAQLAALSQIIVSTSTEPAEVTARLLNAAPAEAAEAKLQALGDQCQSERGGCDRPISM